MFFPPPPPQPDPAPQACQYGWCPIPTVRPYSVVIKLKGRGGLWRCTVTRKPFMLCEKVG